MYYRGQSRWKKQSLEEGSPVYGGYSVLNSSQFANEVANMEISDDDVMVSFDVVSLFTAIPVNKACAYIRDKLNNDNTLHLRR